MSDAHSCPLEQLRSERSSRFQTRTPRALPDSSVLLLCERARALAGPDEASISRLRSSLPILNSQTSIAPRWRPKKRRPSLGVMAMSRIPPEALGGRATVAGSALRSSQTHAVPSSDAERCSCMSDAWRRTRVTGLLCPRPSCRQLPLLRSHTRTLRSHEPEMHASSSAVSTRSETSAGVASSSSRSARHRPGFDRRE
eukprot:Amastigsp_a342597_31.p3 type:complete len:198 gc:universal Amastigsp_a342597_31:110-703(+)